MHVVQAKSVQGYTVTYRHTGYSHLERNFDDLERAEKFARKVKGNIIEQAVIIYR